MSDRKLCDWQDCWIELNRLRKDVHRLFERMRDLSPPTTKQNKDIFRVADVAVNFAADEVGVSPARIMARARGTPGVAWARHIAIAVTHEITGASYAAIKQAFNMRAHKSVVYACERVREEPEKRYKREYEHVLAKTQLAVGRIEKPIGVLKNRGLTKLHEEKYE